MKQKSPFFVVDGHEVSVTFRKEKNPDIISPLKQALIASYISGKNEDDICTFVSAGISGYNGEGGNTDAP